MKPHAKGILLTFTAATSLLASCGGGGGSSGAATADFLVGDAPADDLVSFQAEVASMRLRCTDQTTTTNLLAGPTRVDFLELEDHFAWLATGPLEKTSYDAVLLDFTPASYVAIPEDGSPVAVLAQSDQLVAAFSAPLNIGDGYHRIEIDLDVADSIRGNVSSGSIDFVPTGSSSSSNGSTNEEIDEVKGTVLEVDAPMRRLVIDAFLDDDLVVSLGELTVEAAPNALLLDESGALFAHASAFFSSLVAGSTLLEVHGSIGPGGIVDAERIEVEDAIGGGGPVAVEIEGQVMNIVPGTSFDLLIHEVEKGSSIAGPVLAGLGNPGTITVSFDLGTTFVLDRDGAPDLLTSASDLAVGQEVDVSFATFATEPFPAFRVEIEGEDVEFEGTIVDLGGLPAAIFVNLDDDDPLVLSGAVTTTTDISVDISGVAPFLDIDTEPPLTTTELFVGLEVEVEGSFDANTNPPSIVATKLKVEPGELDDATVATIDEVSSSFTTSGGQVDEPFGDGITTGPLNVVVETGVVIEGDATTLTGLYSLFNGLAAGETLKVEIEGLSSGNPNEVRAFEIEVED